MSIVKSGMSALGRLLILAGLAVAFLFGMVGVVYMSLQGKEVKVPEITGKSFSDSERELTALGLKIHRRADRASSEQPNTILEQLPRPGETVKTGQLIYVVTAKPGSEGDVTPPAIKKGGDEDDSDKIEEMITDKPKKKTNTNSNKKKSDTTRDVNGSTSNSITDSNTAPPDSNTKPANNTGVDKANKSPGTPGKPDKPAANKSAAIKPTSGETRPRTTVKPQ